jgi:hypothetical protein
MADDALLKPLVDLWIHQNNLMWSRVRLLSALQAGALAANYVLHNRFASILICLAAFSATCYLIYVSDIDRMIRDEYRRKLEQDHNFHFGLTSEQRQNMSVDILRFPIPENIISKIPWYDKLKIPASITAKMTLGIIFYSFMCLDLITLLISLWVFC